jgi:hypothetical protein
VLVLGIGVWALYAWPIGTESCRRRVNTDPGVASEF